MRKNDFFLTDLKQKRQKTIKKKQKSVFASHNRFVKNG